MADLPLDLARHAARLLAELAFQSTPHRDQVAAALSAGVREALEQDRAAKGRAAALADAGGGRAEIDCPVLDSHGTSKGNAILHWNAQSAGVTEIDVAVHLHGFERKERPLDLKVMEGISGCDVNGRGRPALGVIPRGQKNGLTKSGTHYVYNFPALTDSASGLDQLIRCALDELAVREMGQPAGSLRRKRLILTAHSGGGARLLKLLKYHDPDEIELFDALYGPPAEAATWAVRHIRKDADVLSHIRLHDVQPHSYVPPSEWREYMRTRGGSLRAVFNPKSSSLEYNSALHTQIECALQEIPDTDLKHLVQDFLRLYYRVERTAESHNEIPRQFGPQILKDAAANLKPMPAALARPGKCSSSAQTLEALAAAIGGFGA